MELHLKIIGWLLVVLAWAHLFFPWYFDWKQELKPLSLMNKQMMMVHLYFIALVVFLVGLLCVTSAGELVSTRLGKIVSGGLAFFWGTRLYFQLFIYSSALWSGKTFETIMHVLFFLFWLYMTVVFSLVSFGYSM